VNKCGTYAGWNAHKRAGTKPCALCLKAAADYTAAWRRRATTPAETRRRELGKARWRAVNRLIAAHQAEFDQYHAEERNRVERGAA
jgi:hypothetical protein